MQKFPLAFVLLILLNGCATTKMAYVNMQKTANQIHEDEIQCKAVIDASDFKDASLREKKFNQCMQERGYKFIPEKEVGRVKGFQEAWVNPDIDFKVYEAIFIEKVDVSQVKVKNMQVPGTKVTDEDIDNLGKEMSKRFLKILNVLMPVVTNEEMAAGSKALRLNLKLNDIARTNIGMNAALEILGHLTPVPIPVSSEGLFCFEGTITDFSSKEKLITILDKSKSDKNASLAGLESFQRWKHAYNTMDYWADCLAALLAQKRGQEYKSQLGLKLVD